MNIPPFTGILHVQLHDLWQKKKKIRKKEKKILSSLLHIMDTDTMCQTSFSACIFFNQNHFCKCLSVLENGDTAGCGLFFGIVRCSQASEANEGRKIKS